MNKPAQIVRTGRKFDQVLEGARSVFMRDGFEGASVDDIAREAGVNAALSLTDFIQDCVAVRYPGDGDAVPMAA